MDKVNSSYQSIISADNDTITVMFIQETPSVIKSIYEGLNVKPTITYDSPFQLSLTNKELFQFIVVLGKKLLYSWFKRYRNVLVK